MIYKNIFGNESITKIGLGDKQQKPFTVLLSDYKFARTEINVSLHVPKTS